MGKMELKDIYVADSLDAKAQKVLQKGGKVLVLAAGKVKMGRRCEANLSAGVLEHQLV